MLTLLYHAWRAARRLFEASAHRHNDGDERYLADAVDIYDLERRMRQVDSRQAGHCAAGASGLLNR